MNLKFLVRFDICCMHFDRFILIFTNVVQYVKTKLTVFCDFTFFVPNNWSETKTD